jgi:hypothetical protein
MATATFVASGKMAVLNRIQQSPALKPTGLLAALGSEYSYTEIQDALSDLLERGEVDLMPDLTLRRVPPPKSIEEK